METPFIDQADEPIAFDAEQPSGLMLEAAAERLTRFDCEDLLRRAGLRPTRQRVELAGLLFSNGDRHVTAERLYAEATEANILLSLATVYNSLHQFTEAGLLRQIGINGAKSWFDTNPTVHPHFFVDGEDMLFDIPQPGVAIDKLPAIVPGYEVSRVDMIVHLRRKRG
jgi:Fur family iron response transcriptional regulator